MKDESTENSSIALVNFYGSLISEELFRKLMQDEDERAAYLDYLHD